MFSLKQKRVSFDSAKYCFVEETESDPVSENAGKRAHWGGEGGAEGSGKTPDRDELRRREMAWVGAGCRW